MYNYMIHHHWLRLFFAIIGTLIGAIALNMFILPFDLYSGGLLGVGQLIRTFLSSVLNIEFEDIDLAGIIYFILNIPILIYAKNIVGKQLLIGTVIGTISYSIFYSLIPIPDIPIISDILTSVIVGGILSGIGSGILLTCGCSGGSLDILGLCFSKKGKSFSIGKFSLSFNIFIYAICLIIFSVEIAIYSIIYSACYAISLDKLHQQNINVEVSIITETKKDQISNYIMNKIGRGVSLFDVVGGYTGSKKQMILVCVSKYEVVRLKRYVTSVDPSAFIIIKEGVQVSSNFSKKLDSDDYHSI
ncbi:MAG: YitT family protein [Pleomorphochaeta sp.]